MKSIVLVAFGGCIGALISALVNAVANYLVKRIEMDTALKSAAIQLGIEEFNQAKDVALRTSTNGSVAYVYPPSYWVQIEYAALKELSKVDFQKNKSIKNFLVYYQTISDFFAEEIERASKSSKTTTT